MISGEPAFLEVLICATVVRGHTFRSPRSFIGTSLTSCSPDAKLRSLRVTAQRALVVIPENILADSGAMTCLLFIITNFFEVQWALKDHVGPNGRPGRFSCRLCRFEQMRQHQHNRHTGPRRQAWSAPSPLATGGCPPEAGESDIVPYRTWHVAVLPGFKMGSYVRITYRLALR